MSPCTHYSGVVAVCAPRPTECRRVVRWCPTCRTRRRMVVLVYAWYGWDVTCCACGEVWQDGERAERPFRPRWREKNAKAARKLWKELTQ